MKILHQQLDIILSTAGAKITTKVRQIQNLTCIEKGRGGGGGEVDVGGHAVTYLSTMLLLFVCFLGVVPSDADLTCKHFSHTAYLRLPAESFLSA